MLAKELPVLYNRKEECCGCTACYAICPMQAILMVEDEEGFEYPQVNESKCVKCYLCLKVCPFKLKVVPAFENSILPRRQK
ncbi:NADH-quinone oxidoreductase subunit I [Eisenbergiella sp.]